MEHTKIRLRFKSEALPLAIAKLETPAFSRYELALLVWNLYEKKTLNGTSIIGLQRTLADRRAFQAAEAYLLKTGLIKNLGQEKSAFYVWAGLGERELSKFELVSCLDIFCAISHLSAMEWHGLTNRISETVFYTTPSSQKWQNLSREKMQIDLDSQLYKFLYVERMPSLQRVNLNRIGKRLLNRHETKNNFNYVKGSELVRVTSIARTYLDMIRTPILCGGLSHVFESIKDNGKRHLKLILKEFDVHGTAIDKVRMGFLLESLCKIESSILDEWAHKYASRGGSRKLDPQMPYEPRFSEKWCLSINTKIELNNEYD